ncbi:MAG: hypothetical protein ACFFFK_10820 [Candidatus Thorarchaeota archaeon]
MGTMDSGFLGRRRIIGTTASASLFIAWILIDLYVFPLIGIETHYPLYELVTYSSWAVIALVCFLLLAWAGWFPMKAQEPDPETPAEA